MTSSASVRRSNVGPRLARVLCMGMTASALAGPLNPPAGPIVSTPGPEPRIAINSTNTPGDADSLFKITQPGSYYLTGNITGVANKHGIEITVGAVTLDLSGFAIIGAPGIGSVDGISALAPGSVRVYNGTVQDWGDCGIDAFGSNGCSIEHIRATGNATYGIRGSNRTLIKDCIAISNGTSGIRAASGGMVVGCISGLNTANGIEVASACVVQGNNCYSNGSGAGDGAGILVLGTDNRIEGNNCTNADRGIDVDLAGNIIIKNTCSNNAINWQIAANNVCGPILDRTAPASAAISGNSAPDSTGSTHPNANFTY